MANYDFSGLSSRSFEKLIQAIAGKVLGLGTITFGDGPDGGREATFEGRMDYPSQADKWVGYCVVQAKFRQRGGRISDGSWALKQLEAELKGFTEYKKRRRRPDYYVFVTNVVLTPVQKKGGKDRAQDLINKYKQKLGLRAGAVWDFDEIARFLDSFSDIRQTYAAYITPGDVLAEVINQLHKKPDFLEIITNFLAKELRNDQFANLEQAGHSIEERIPLASVFVDLPVTAQRSQEPPPDEGPIQEPKVIEFIVSLMDIAADRMDPMHQQGEVIQEGRLSRPEGPQPGRIVLVGGPGQGKTTVGQYACQLFRAALLHQRPSHQIPPEVKDALTAIVDQCREGPVSLPRARRFPVRIVLSEFAAALNANPDLALVGFLARQIERRTQRLVSIDDLRRWLGAYPWFIVLDGLDEVPASTNREDVLKKIEDFWIDASQLNADVLVLATTRPQGYSQDFSPKYYRHLWMAPLSPKRAMDYARRLVAVRYAGEPDRQARITTRLQEASKQDATARLMRSPLQITIMAALVDQAGTPPQDRWRLFHDYYEVIYNREKERPIPAAELLRDHKPNIDAIHHQVGLILQIESEQAGGTETKLPAHRFAKLVTARLEEEGFSGTVLSSLHDRIIDAAANRLVFLVGLEAGQVGFEIRSLQEYMAAEALMTGTQDSIQERLRRIAPIASWRNVFLFAAGRCFLQEQYLRDTIHTICIELNDQPSEPIEKAIRAGSVLAIDLLEDGIGRRQPKYARLLAQSAVLVLDLPPSEVHASLAGVCEDDVAVIVRENLTSKLSLPFPQGLGAWTTLLSLVGRGIHWAIELADHSWPSSSEEELNILSLPTARHTNDWVRRRTEQVLRRNSPIDARYRLRHGPIQAPANVVELDTLLWPATVWQPHREGILSTRVFQGFAFYVIPLDSAREVANRVRIESGDLHPDWLPIFEEIKFARSPSKESLAEGLHRISRSNDTKLEPLLFPKLSWVFSSCLSTARTKEELRQIALRAEKGELGDTSDWIAAERRWREEEISVKDFTYLTDDKWPFDSTIAKIGLPIAGMLQSGPLNPGASSINQFIDLFSNLKGLTRTQQALAPILFELIDRYDRPSPPVTLTPERFISVFNLSSRYWFDAEVAWKMAGWAGADPQWLDVIDKIGTTRQLFLTFGRRDLRFIPRLLAGYSDRPGILPLIASVLNDISLKDLATTPNRYEAFESPYVRWAAIMIELWQGEVNQDRVKHLVEATLRMESNPNLMDLRVALGRGERIGDSVYAYVMELYRQMPVDDWDDKATLIAILNEAMRRRSSGVADPAVWKSLSLPEELFSLITQTSP